ncbi:hypothetical protein PRIPAC_95042 [Pristionchus pacificus]|nr:hypothetical protein PRIPAC_95042 [Pristionchus pacificus]
MIQDGFSSSTRVQSKESGQSDDDFNVVFINKNNSYIQFVSACSNSESQQICSNFSPSHLSRSIDISLVIVYTEGTPLENYATALNSIECYAKLHSYPFHLFSDAKYKECARHKDLFFRRHCCIARHMTSQLKQDSWILVLDGDIAVINPNTLIEQFIDPSYDITLFDRFFNFEVGANSYLVRNTQRGREFVRRFAEYEFRLPKSFHGTDNGALHRQSQRH